MYFRLGHQYHCSLQQLTYSTRQCPSVVLSTDDVRYAIKSIHNPDQIPLLFVPARLVIGKLESATCEFTRSYSFFSL